MSTLVACGGTGAHVALAFIRLHTLGHALGFFRQPGDRPLDFPSIFLVDQDAGDGREEKTAWQLARQFVDEHPAGHDWLAATGRRDSPDLREVTPLPIGPDRGWFNSPYDQLSRRFSDSAYLDLLTAAPQRAITYSKGMMGSPAIGSLLLELKRQDRKANGLNNDDAYELLCKERGRIAVVGSGVGGTGASVGPSLALELEKAGADVMAVMVLSWFKFNLRGLDDATRDRAQLRNDAIRENANSALQFYGQRLAPVLATVPVGSPDRGVITRRFTSDTQQPVEESYLHGVAALSAMWHYTGNRPLPAGLYQMGAEDTGKLGGGTQIPGGTLQCLADRAETLADCLSVAARVLRSGSASRSRLRLVPALLQHVREPGRVGEELDLLAVQFGSHLKWLRSVLKVEPRRRGAFTLERRVKERLAADPLRLADGPARAPADSAREVFQWFARWIAAEATPENGLSHRPGQVDGGYWPQLRDDGLSPAAKGPGVLRAVPDQSIGATLQGFVDPRFVTANGWPSPVAAADHFRYAIEEDKVAARRQLEMLLVGLMREVLELRVLPEIGSTRAGVISLERLVSEQRAGRMHGFATHAVVYPSTRGDIVLGFNSPATLLAATALLPADHETKEVWAKLWSILTDSALPENWDREPGSVVWRSAMAEVNQLRFWLQRQIEAHEGQSPPWAKVLFQDQTGVPEEKPYGMGVRFTVDWDGAAIDVNLPTRESGESELDVEDALTIGRDILEERVPGLDRLDDDTFWKVEMEMPGRQQHVEAYWADHLTELQRRDQIVDYRARPDTQQLHIWTRSRERGLEVCVLNNAIVLDRDAMLVHSCTPMRQDPVPGSSRSSGETLYPSLPIRSDFLDVVRTSDGRGVLEELKTGGSRVDPEEFRPSIRQRAGSSTAEWSLHLRGRRDPLPFALPVPSDEDLHRSHWMVWPNFRSVGDEGAEHQWRAYYVYDHCTDRRIRVDVLWLDPDGGGVQRRKADTEIDYGGSSLSYETGGRRRHTGGPPLAFVARNTVSGREEGIYLLHLEQRSRSGRAIKLGVDFGTSHTVAAFLDGTAEAQIVKLLPQLADRPPRELTLHVSEDREHCTEDVLPKALWSPTYVRDLPQDAVSLLPSELLVRRRLSDYRADEIANWQPGRDYFIPPMNLGRKELAQHIVADFKWDASFPAFQGHEDSLREIYLNMVLEQVLADVVDRQRRLPMGRVDVTFTYPLRSSREEVRQYRETVRRVLESCSDSLGMTLGLTDDVGLYDESSAAKGGTEQVGDVSVVADLGGGTLDLFISAKDAPGAKFDEVADSVRLGANLLLRKLAENPERFLPKGGGWSTVSADECEKQLRAWMRSRGSHALFGAGQAGTRLDLLGLLGFDNPTGADEARALISRYFRLLIDYIARYVVAYLGTHWRESAGANEGKLKLWLQLRGNGWRLWHGSDDYEDIQAWAREQLVLRTASLWNELDVASGEAPDESRWKKAVGRQESPKLAPILRAVGKARQDLDVRRSRRRHVLIDLDLLGAGVPDERVRWYARQPFNVGSGSARVEFGGIRPTIHLGAPGGDLVVLDDLETEQRRKVNTLLEERGERHDQHENDFQADVAAWVWEAAFESRKLLDNE